MQVENQEVRYTFRKKRNKLKESKIRIKMNVKENRFNGEDKQSIYAREILTHVHQIKYT